MDDREQRLIFARPLRPDQLVMLDGLAAGAYLVIFFALPGPAGDAAAAPAPAGLRLLALTGIAVPLVVRRRWPVPVFVAVLAQSLLWTALGTVRDSLLAAAFALYPVALTGPRQRWASSPVAGVVSAVGLAGLALVGGPALWNDRVGHWLFGLVALAVAWTVGRAVRERRAFAARAAVDAAERAAAEERLRIGRELHDVIAHGVGVIAVQAGVANHLAERRPDQARAALRVIESTSRDTLVELRHLLGVLRRPGPSGGPADLVRPGSSGGPMDPARPAPGLADLSALAERAATAGVCVELDIAVAGHVVPDGLALSAYRIVQEALTNVVRHAAPTTCGVRLAASGGELTVEVTDRGPTRDADGSDESGRADPTEGFGLVGMRERVIRYGGTFAAGPEPAGGFTVRARLPMDPAVASERLAP